MQIVDFRPELAGPFKALNEAWITQYFTLEPKGSSMTALNSAGRSRPGVTSCQG
jgi:hypothetical protein